MAEMQSLRDKFSKGPPRPGQHRMFCVKIRKNNLNVLYRTPRCEPGRICIFGVPNNSTHGRKAVNSYPQKFLIEISPGTGSTFWKLQKKMRNFEAEVASADGSQIHRHPSSIHIHHPSTKIEKSFNFP